MSHSPFADDPLEEEFGRGGRPLSEVLGALRRRGWLIAFCVVVALAAAAVISWKTPPQYRASALLEFEKERPSPVEIGVGAAREGGPDPETLATETQLMKNREVANRVAAKLAPPGSVTDPTDPRAATRASLRIQKSIEVRPVKGTNLIELSCTAESPQRASDLTNAVADAYIDWKLETKFRLIQQASKLLGSQIQESKQTLAEKEQKLLALGRQKDILSIAPQSSVAVQKLNALSQDTTSAMAERIGKEARYNELLRASPEDLPDSLLTPAIQQMKADLARLEQEYAQKLNVFKPEWPAMVSLKSQIETARKNLEVATRESLPKAREAAKVEYQTALRREESLKDALQRQRAEAMSLSRDSVDYNNLWIEVETQRALVDSLLKREAETQVVLRLQGERLSNIRVVESALPPGRPFKPSYAMNGLLGLFAGFAAGFGLALMLESLDRSLRSPEQAKEYLRLPVLGVIPPAQAATERGYGYGYGYSDASASETAEAATSDAKPRRKVPIELLPHERPRSVVAEAYRAFRTSLLLSQADGVRSLVVSSAVPLEGKSSTATNLAIVLGQLGRRVLLVDSDLRRPRIHEILNLSNRVGLSSVLAVRTDPTEAIVPTSVPNVFVLPAGPPPPDPSGLLSSEAMRRFLAYAIEAFDNVIFDSPPILAFADAILIGNLTDGVVLCFQAGRTPREKVARARDELLRSRVHVLGVLMNRLRDESAKGDGYRRSAPPKKSMSIAEAVPGPKAVTATHG